MSLSTLREERLAAGQLALRGCVKSLATGQTTLRGSVESLSNQQTVANNEQRALIDRIDDLDEQLSSISNHL